MLITVGGQLTIPLYFKMDTDRTLSVIQKLKAFQNFQKQKKMR